MEIQKLKIIDKTIIIISSEIINHSTLNILLAF